MTKQPNSSSLGHSIGKLMVRGLLGAVSIAATAVIPIMVQRYFAPAPSAPSATSTPASAPAPQTSAQSNPQASQPAQADQTSVQPGSQAPQTAPTDSEKTPAEQWRDRLWKKWDKK